MAPYWSAFAHAVAASPALVAGWVALAAAFAVGSTWLLLRLLPRAATDNPVRRVAQNSAFPMVPLSYETAGSWACIPGR